jgi:hypothetical protein
MIFCPSCDWFGPVRIKIAAKDDPAG